MCLLDDASSRRRRTLLGIGLLCLSMSLLSQAANLSFGLSAAVLDAVRGLLLGFAIALLLISAIAARRGRCARG